MNILKNTNPGYKVLKLKTKQNKNKAKLLDQFPGSFVLLKYAAGTSALDFSLFWTKSIWCRILCNEMNICLVKLKLSSFLRACMKINFEKCPNYPLNLPSSIKCESLHCNLQIKSLAKVQNHWLIECSRCTFHWNSVDLMFFYAHTNFHTNKNAMDI